MKKFFILVQAFWLVSCATTAPKRGPSSVVSSEEAVSFFQSYCAFKTAENANLAVIYWTWTPLKPKESSFIRNLELVYNCSENKLKLINSSTQEELSNDFYIFSPQRASRYDGGFLNLVVKDFEVLPGKKSNVTYFYSTFGGETPHIYSEHRLREDIPLIDQVNITGSEKTSFIQIENNSLVDSLEVEGLGYRVGEYELEKRFRINPVFAFSPDEKIDTPEMRANVDKIDDKVISMKNFVAALEKLTIPEIVNFDNVDYDTNSIKHSSCIIGLDNFLFGSAVFKFFADKGWVPKASSGIQPGDENQFYIFAEGGSEERVTEAGGIFGRKKTIQLTKLSYKLHFINAVPMQGRAITSGIKGFPTMTDESKKGYEVLAKKLAELMPTCTKI